MGKFSREITIGYKYYAGLHMVICEGPATVTGIKVGGKYIYEYYRPWAEGIADTSIDIDKENLFGGDEKEGGISGRIDIMSGKKDQQPNDYLISQLGPDVPAFRGVLSLVARQCYLSALNPYIKPWWVRVTRKPWFPEEWDFPEENYDYWDFPGVNPVVILYEIITEHGLGPIDEESFKAAAGYFQERKLCLLWDGGSVEDLIQTVLDHAGCMLFVNPFTGKFQIHVLADAITMPYEYTSLSENVISEVTEYQRTSIDDTINQLTVYYVDYIDGEEKCVTIQNLANINAQGRIVAAERKYPGIPTREHAMYVANRDLIHASVPLSKIRLVVAKNALSYAGILPEGLLPGSRIKVFWPKLGLNGVSFIVGEVDFGTELDNIITIDAVEDVYDTKETYIDIQEPLWNDPVPEPVPAIYQKALEMPYWDIRRNTTDADFNTIPQNEGVGFLYTFAAPPISCNFGYKFYVGADLGGQSEFCPMAFLGEDIGFLDSKLTINSPRNIDLASFNDQSYAVIGDEIVGTTGIHENTITIRRGCLDTVAKPHMAGEIIYFVTGWYGSDKKQYVLNQDVDVRICTITGKGELRLGLAQPINVWFNARFDRPYPPAYPTINRIPYPEGITFDNNPELNITWRHRNRILQTAYIVDHSEGSITPEEGTTYSVEIKHVLNNEVLFRQDGIEGTSIVVPSLNVDGELLVRIWSVRDGFESWQKQEFTIKYYVGNAPEEPEEPEENERLTEDGIQRITEDSAVRLVEAEVSEDVLYARYTENGELRNTEENETRRIEEPISEGALFTRYTEENEIRLAENGVERRVEDQVTEDIIFARYDESGNERITEGNIPRRVEDQVSSDIIFARYDESGNERITESGITRRVEDQVSDDVIFARYDESGNERITKSGITRRVEDQVAEDIIFARYDESGNERITEGGILRRVEDQVSIANMFLRYTEGGDKRCNESGELRSVENPTVAKILFLRYNENGEERLNEEGDFRNIEYDER